MDATIEASTASAANTASFTARASTSLLWTTNCLDSDCPLGSTAADSLCSWADHSKNTICLIPTRFLGGGLPAGPLAWSDLAEVIPPHMIAYVSLTAADVKKAILSGLRAARRDCPVHQSPTWQLSGARLAVSACDWDNNGGSELSLKQPNGSFTRLNDAATLRVLTLAPALPLLLLGDSSQPKAELKAISAQHVLADYLRAHSPFDASSTVTREARIVLTGESSCTTAIAPSACAKVGGSVTMGAFRAAGLADFHAARAHDIATSSVRSGALITPLLLMFGLCTLLVAYVRRGRRMRAAEDELLRAATTPAVGGGGRRGGDGLNTTSEPSPSPVVATMPTFARGAMGGSGMYDAGEREPLRTGSQRLVSIAELGP